MSTPKDIPVLTDSDRVRFWAKVNRHGPTLPKMGTPCWLWMFCITGPGYGGFRLVRKVHYAHRIAFVLGGGVFTEAKPQANHRCGNRACCNPDHIYAGTHRENMNDTIKDGTVARRWGDANGARLHPEKLARGKKIWSYKLTDAQCAYIRSSPLSGVALGRELGVSDRHISAIRRGKKRRF